MIVVFGCLLEQVAELGDLVRFLPGLRERHVDVVVQQHDEAHLAGEVEDAVERRVRSGSRVSPAIFDETNSLWIVNSPMPVNTPGNVVSTRRM